MSRILKKSSKVESSYKEESKRSLDEILEDIEYDVNAAYGLWHAGAAISEYEDCHDEIHEAMEHFASLAQRTDIVAEWIEEAIGTLRPSDIRGKQELKERVNEILQLVIDDEDNDDGNAYLDYNYLLGLFEDEE